MKRIFVILAVAILFSACKSSGDTVSIDDVTVEIVTIGYIEDVGTRLRATNDPELLAKMQGAAMATRRWNVVKPTTAPSRRNRRRAETEAEAEDTPPPIPKIRVFPPKKRDSSMGWQLFLELDGVMQTNIKQKRFSGELEDMFHQRLMMLLHMRQYTPRDYEKYQDKTLEAIREEQEGTWVDKLAEKL